jgi:tellurite resistance protein TehA-like permease
MAMMILGLLWEKHIGYGIILWTIAIILHSVLVAAFVPYLVNLEIRQVNPSWIIGPIGFTLASGTGHTIIGDASSYFFYAGLLAAIIMVPLTLYRAYLHPEPVPDWQAPLHAIFAAPAALLLTNWFAIGGSAAHALTHILAAAELLLLLFVAARARALSALPFYPSMAAFTFPSEVAARSVILYAAAIAAAADGRPGSKPLPPPASAAAVAAALLSFAVVGVTLARFAARAWARVAETGGLATYAQL